MKEIDGSRPGEIYERASQALDGYQGVSKRSLQGHVAWLIEHGYADRVVGQDGIDRLVRTQKGDLYADKEHRPLLLLSYLLTEEGLAKRMAGVERRREEKSEQRRSTRAKRPQDPSPSAISNRKARHIYRTDLDGRLRIDLNGRKSVFYLQLLTPLDEIVTALVHHQLHVGWDESGYPRYANAISPKEPALGGDADPILDHWDIFPWQATIGVAASLDKTGTGFELAETTSADGEIVPAVGFLLEDTRDFWYPLATSIPAPDGRVLRVRRQGRWNDRRFEFEDVGPGLEIRIPAELDLNAYVEEIASEERLMSILTSIPEHRPLKHHVR